MAASAMTVCLGTYSSRSFIAPTLDALMRQEHAKFRVVISDDASPDGTAQFCREHLGDDPRFRILERPRNVGWVENYRQMLLGVETPHVCFTFHDDLLRPAFLSSLAWALDRAPSAVLAFSDITFGTNDFVPLPTEYTALEGVEDPKERARSIIAMRGSWWIPFRGVVRTDVALRCADALSLDPGDGFSADWLWLLRLSLEGAFLRVPRVLYTKNWRRSGRSLTWQRSLADEIRLRQRARQVVRSAGREEFAGLQRGISFQIATLPLRRIARRLLDPWRTG